MGPGPVTVRTRMDALARDLVRFSGLVLAVDGAMDVERTRSGK